jgi:hypothetical protein
MGKPEKDGSYRLFLVGLYRVIIPVNQLLRVFDLLIEEKVVKANFHCFGGKV